MAATLKCDTIQNAASANPNITLDTAANATVGGTMIMGSSFLRNRIINGGMSIDQRNAGASQTITAAAALAYTVDRWYAYCTGANVTGQRVANSGVSSTSPSQYAYQFTGAASVTAIGFAQRIEAVNSYDLAGSTATLSVSLSNSLLTTVTWTAYYANTTDTFGTLASPTVTQIATGTFTVNSTLTRYSTNITIPSAATTGIQIVFSVGAQTSGTWVIGNVQLEVGSVATPFERELYNVTLAKCQRYLPAFTAANASVNCDFMTGYVQSTNTGTCFYTFQVLPRVPPTGITVTNAGSASMTTQAYSSAVSSIAFSNASQQGARLTVTTSGSSFTVPQPTLVYATATNFSFYLTGCEL